MKKGTLLQVLREVRTPKGRIKHQRFSIEGYRLVERCLGSQGPLRAVLVEERMMETPTPRELAILESLEESSIPVVPATLSEVEEFTEGRTFGPMMGVVQTLKAPSLSQWLVDQDAPCKLLVLVEAKDPGNLGALMRTGKASNADALLVVGGTDPFHPKAARTSMGAIFDIPILTLPLDPNILTLLRDAQIQTIGAIVEEGVAPYEGEVSDRHALFMGSEAHGLPAEWQPHFDTRWTIPMSEEIDSFSINAATSVLLYELNRRKWMGSITERDREST
ncbi:MAG: RNA methyltransferase [Deltaproteobacteria bacterium]|nr:MAG: RNA methyltransferase [Deltaproteobacteria bacterium]